MPNQRQTQNFVRLGQASFEPDKRSHQPVGPGMASAGNDRAILLGALKYENSSRWLRAVSVYQDFMLSISREDVIQQAEISERIGFCLFCAARQARNLKQFKKRIHRAILAYRSSRHIRGGLKGTKDPWLLRCSAMEIYLRYWLASTPREKRRLLDLSWKISKEAMRRFESAGNYLEYARTYNHMSGTIAINFHFYGSFAAWAQKLGEAVEHGRKAVRMLLGLGEKRELTKAYVRTALFLDESVERGWAAEKKEQLDQEAAEYWKEALRLDRELAVLETSQQPIGFCRILNNNESLQIYEEALRLAKRSKDNFAVGLLQDQLARGTFYKAAATQEPGQRAGLAAESLRLAEKAASKFESFNFANPNSGVMWVHSPYAEYFLDLSLTENNSSRIRLLLEKSLRASRELVRLARISGYPKVMSYGHHIFGKTALAISRIETSPLRRKSFLRQCLHHRAKCCRIVARIEGDESWNRGVVLTALGEVQAELARMERDSKTKGKLLLGAVQSSEEGLRLCVEYLESAEKGLDQVHRPSVGRYYYAYADLLSNLYNLRGNEENLKKAARAFAVAAKCYQNSTMYSRVAECYWKVAQTYDALQLDEIASENFHLAARNYEAAAQKIPQLRVLYQEFEQYLDAWSSIERARGCHKRGDYDKAAKFYVSAVEHNRSSKRWNFLVPYYTAWAGLESAESLSKEGQYSEAAEAFAEAAGLFQEARISLRRQVAVFERADEKAMIAVLANAPREQFCRARALIEEARVAESKGDYHASSEKFALASEKLTETSKRFKSERDEKELRLIAMFSKAWQLMTKARANGGENFWAEACKLFERAKEISPTGNAAILATAHLQFCKAQEATQKFYDTLDNAQYEVAITHLRLATNHYLTSGFMTASDHARGLKLLLDAHIQIVHGDKESSQEARSGFYRAAGTLLRQAADAFESARQFDSREQVVKLLEKIDLDWELSAHLTEISNVASNPQTNVAFPTPARGHEWATGIERFEGTDVEARLTTGLETSRSGAILELEIEIANTGRHPIRLVKLEDAIPRGAHLLEIPEACHQEGYSLAINQRRIEPLKFENLKLSIRCTALGLILLKPRIVFLDENGLERRSEIEKKVFVTSEILAYLARSFADDYKMKALEAGHCGWRTLTDIVRVLKIPRSHVYGDSRYGWSYGKQLGALLKAGLVELRRFPGERGRGGNIARVRVLYDNEAVKQHVDSIVQVLGGVA